jgi:hypothetical protein
MAARRSAVTVRAYRLPKELLEIQGQWPLRTAPG